MRKLSVLGVILLFCVCASLTAEADSDLQIGFSFSSQREEYTDSGNSFSNNTYRVGAEIANFNTFSSGFGFFELMNFDFFRKGTASSDLSADADYDSYPFFAFSFLAGPAFRYRMSGKAQIQAGVGFHYLYQFWESDGYEFTDQNLGAGIIFNYKHNLTDRLSLVAGISTYYDFYCSKSYEYKGDSYTIPADDFSRIGIEPHILLSINF